MDIDTAMDAYQFAQTSKYIPAVTATDVDLATD